MCRDYTKKISKIAPCAKGEKKYANIQVIRTIILKISNLEANLEIFKRIVRITCIFSFFFTLPAWSDFGKFFCIVSTHTKLHVQAKNLPFWIFIGYMMYGFLSQAVLTLFYMERAFDKPSLHYFCCHFDRDEANRLKT